MQAAPEDHPGAEGTDVAQVLHMGPTAGVSLPHHSLVRNVGFEMNLYAYTLPDGRPGRPFVRLADDDAEGDTFDTHEMQELEAYRDALITSLAGLTGFLQEIHAWDWKATDTSRAWDKEARRRRPCQSRAGQENSAPHVTLLPARRASACGSS